MYYHVFHYISYYIAEILITFRTVCMYTVQYTGMRIAQLLLLLQLLYNQLTFSFSPPFFLFYHFFLLIYVHPFHSFFLLISVSSILPLFPSHLCTIRFATFSSTFLLHPFPSFPPPHCSLHFPTFSYASPFHPLFILFYSPSILSFCGDIVLFSIQE